MSLSPERLNALGDAGAKAAREEETCFNAIMLLDKDMWECEESEWEDEVPARAAFAEAVLKESGFYDLLAALKKYETHYTDSELHQLVECTSGLGEISPAIALRHVLTRDAIEQAEGGRP